MIKPFKDRVNDVRTHAETVIKVATVIQKVLEKHYSEFELEMCGLRASAQAGRNPLLTFFYEGPVNEDINYPNPEAPQIWVELDQELEKLGLYLEMATNYSAHVCAVRGGN